MARWGCVYHRNADDSHSPRVVRLLIGRQPERAGAGWSVLFSRGRMLEGVSAREGHVQQSVR